MAKTLKLQTEQPPPPKGDLVFGDISQERSPPLSLAFISALMELIKESWNQPSTSSPVACRTENLYRTHGDDTNFLLKHPVPNSIIVQLNSSKSSGKAHVTPTNREGQKLDVLGQNIYSFTTFLLIVVNYQVAMGAYQRQLWS